MQEMREKMKTDTSLLVVGGADEQVSFWMNLSCGLFFESSYIKIKVVANE